MKSLICYTTHENCNDSTCTMKKTRNELINNAAIRCYDNGGKTADRYTVIYMDERENSPGTFACVGMNHEPFHPQGIGMHSSAMPGKHLGKRIAFADLPADCQRLVNQDTKPPELSAFVKAYLIAALWTWDDNAGSGDYTGRGLSLLSEFTPCALAEAIRDCEAFQKENAADLEKAEMDDSRAGHCFWLNRNGHGSGFWDEYSQTTCEAYEHEQTSAIGSRDFSERDALKNNCGCKYHACKRLSDACRKAGSADLYAGDDGRLFFS